MIQNIYIPVKFILLMLFITIAGKAQSQVLSGRWVNVATSSDTLTFISNGENHHFVLGRGTEKKDGVLLPKAHAGMYEYELYKDSIALRWMLSSNSNLNKYKLTFKDDHLTICNFFMGEYPGNTLTFRKLQE